MVAFKLWFDKEIAPPEGEDWQWIRRKDMLYSILEWMTVVDKLVNLVRTN